MKKRKVKIRPSAFLALFLVIVLAVAYFGYNKYQTDLTPVDTDEIKTIEIKAGTTLYQALVQLEEEGIIRNSDSAKLYAKINKLSDIKAGVYRIEPGKNVGEVIQYLSENNALSDETMITIPEGYWAKHIAKLIGSELNGVSEEELLNAWCDKDYVSSLIKDYDILTEDILNDESKVYLEGYLFPETYSFFTTTNVDEVTRRLLDQSESVYDKYKEQFEASKYTTHELMTFASILQFESGNEDEMKLIASVFYNRLENNWKLQSCVTVCYAKYKDYSNWKECGAYEGVESPYNTYYYDGFPPSPVDNPGLKAIEATLFPDKSDYFFFIGDVNGSQKTIFAKTYEEHLKNIDKYLK